VLFKVELQSSALPYLIAANVLDMTQEKDRLAR
jgi:hypothetical protein